MNSFKYIILSNIINVFANLLTLILISKTYSLNELRYLFLAQSLFLVIYSVSFSNIYYNLFTSYKTKKYKVIFTQSFYGYLFSSIFLFIFINLCLVFFNISIKFKLVIIIINFILLLEPLSFFYYHLYLKKLFRIIFYLKTSSLIMGLSIKLFLILHNFNIVIIAIAFIVEQIFFTILVILYFKNLNYKIFNHQYLKKFNFISFLKKNYQFPIIGLSVFLILRIDIFFIDYYLDHKFVTIYSIISRPIIIGFGFLVLINQYYFSKMNFINLRLKKFYNIYYQKLICINFFIYLTALILIFLFADFYLGLFGSYYKDYKYLMIYLCVMSFFASIVNVWFNHMVINKKILTVLYFHCISILIYVTLNYYFILFWGVDGVVISMIFSLFISIIIVNLNNPQEIYLITRSLSPINLISNAKIIINETLIKKKPEKKDT
jgi:O-antigen/teichoic acid export membrane protein